jgi:anti-sigma factor RsiW
VTPFRSPRELPPVGAGDEYARWDAAYVLGSLSSSDRREYEAHLSGCPACRASVSELAGMPTLLARLDLDDLAAIDDGTFSAPPPPGPQVLTSLLAKLTRRRRHTRRLAWSVAAAAAVVLVTAALVGSNPSGWHRRPRPRRLPP